MTKTLGFIVQGTPIAKQRSRSFVDSRSKRINHLTPKKTIQFENLVKLSYRSQHGSTQLSGAIAVDIKFTFEPPQSWSGKKKRESVGKYKTTKPDVDNLVKSVLDGLNGVAYGDDGCVVAVNAVKVFGEDAKSEVLVRELDND